MQQIKTLSKNLATNAKNSLKTLFSNKITYFYLGLFALLLGAVYSEYFAYVIFALVLAVSIIFSFSDSLTFSLCLFPFSVLLSIKGTIMFIVPLAICLGVQSIKYIVEVIKKQKQVNWWFVGIMLAFVVYSVLPISSPLQADKGKFYYFYSLLCEILFFDLIYLLYIYKDEIKTNKLLHLFVISLLISCFYGLLRGTSSRLESLIPTFNSGNRVKYNGLVSFNPNGFALLSGIVVSVLMYMIVSSKIGYSACFYIIFLMFFGTLTLSRQFIFAFLIAFVLMIIGSLFKKNYVALKSISIIVVVLLAIVVLLKDEFSVLLGRLSLDDLVNGYGNSTELSKDELMNVGDPGRGGLIKLYMLDFVSSAQIVLFGRGIFTGYINSFNGHNTFLHMLWETGIVGTVGFAAVLFMSVLYFTKSNFVGTLKNIFGKIDNYLLYIPICALLFVENIFLKPMFIVAAAIFVCALLTNQKDLEETKIQNNEAEDNLIIQNEKDISE